MGIKNGKNSLALACLTMLIGLGVGQHAAASVEPPAAVIELRVFGFLVKVWALGDGYTVELVKSPIVKPSPVGR